MGHPTFRLQYLFGIINKISPCSLDSGCSSMDKVLDYRSWKGASCEFEPPGRHFPDTFQQLFLSQFLVEFYARPSELQ